MHENWIKLEYKDLVEKLQGMEKKQMPYYFFGQPVHRGDKRIYQAVALFLKKDPEAISRHLRALLSMPSICGTRCCPTC